MADLIVNHISRDSPQFRDFREKGSASEYAGLFLTRDRVFGKAPSAAEVARSIGRGPERRSPRSRSATERRETLWTTFTPSQIDIDVTHPQGSAISSESCRRSPATASAWCASTPSVTPSRRPAHRAS